MSCLFRLSRKVFHQRAKFSAQEVEPGVALQRLAFCVLPVREPFFERLALVHSTNRTCAPLSW